MREHSPSMKSLLYCTGIGLLFGLLCLIQTLGVLTWMPPDIFRVLHSPATFLSLLLVPGEGAWDVIPYAVVLQWVVVGGAIGVLLHLWIRPRHK